MINILFLITSVITLLASDPTYGLFNKNATSNNSLICSQTPSSKPLFLGYNNEEEQNLFEDIKTGWFYNVLKKQCEQTTIPRVYDQTSNFFKDKASCDAMCQGQYTIWKDNLDPRLICNFYLILSNGDPNAENLTKINGYYYNIEAKECEEITLNIGYTLSWNFFKTMEQCKSFCWLKYEDDHMEKTFLMNL